ncbi:MAG: mechanosensitive ion channel domain-containing protein [Myxococcota bacterium]
MRRMRLPECLFAVALSLAAVQVVAQEAPAPAPAAAPPAPVAPAAPEAPVPVPAPEIVGRSEELKAELKHIESRSAPDATELEIEAKLPELASKLTERSTRANELLEGAVSIEALSDLSSEWRSRSEALAAWRLALTRRAVAIEAEIDGLQRFENEWEATRESAAAAGLPQSTRERVSETLAALNEAQKQVKRRRTHILALQNDVAQQELVVTGVLERVSTLRRELQSRLFARDEPPLWSPDAYTRTADPTPLREQVLTHLSDAIGELGEFIRLDVNRFVWQGVVFLFVLLGLLIARARVSQWALEDPTLAATARIFTRPVSSAIVVSMLSTQFASSRATTVATDLEAVILLVPMLRLLPIELYGGLRVGILGLALLFVFGTLRSLVGGVSIVERYRLLIEALGGVALLAYMLRPKNAVHFVEVGRFGGAVLPIARVALGLLAVAALANVIGMLSVSRLLVRGTLSSAYSAVAAYALTRIAGGALTALLRSSRMRQLRLVRDHSALLRRRIATFLGWTAAASWIVASLRFFRIDDEVFSALRTVVTAKLELGTLSVSLGEVLAFFLTIWIAFTLSRFLRFVLEEDVVPRVSLPRGVPAAISTGIHYAILLIGFTLAIGAAGIDMSRFSLLAGAFGVGIGFGLQNVVNNFVSGLILLFERPVQTGDTIEVGPLSGEVQRIGIRSSTIRTFEGADVIVPNASLISDRVVNWTFSDRQRRIDMDVGLGYDTDPAKAIALLVGVGRAHAEVLAIPEPVAFFTGFGDSALNFSLRVWTRFEIGVRVRSELGIAVNAALREAGIEIPYPQRDMNLKLAPGTSELPFPLRADGG